MYFFEKGIRRSWGIFQNFCVKSNLTSKVTFNCKLEKNGGAGCTSCSVNNFVLLLGEKVLSCSAGSRAYTL